MLSYSYRNIALLTPTHSGMKPYSTRSPEVSPTSGSLRASTSTPAEDSSPDFCGSGAPKPMDWEGRVVVA